MHFKYKYIPASILFLFLIFFSARPGFVSEADTIQIAELKESFQLTVPVSKLTLMIPKSGLVLKKNSQGGSTDSRRYFYFNGQHPSLIEEDHSFIISGWFEPEEEFSGIKPFWKGETAAWEKKGLPEPKNVSFEKIGGWEVVLYDTDLPPQYTGNNSHIRTELAQAGTWIDMHLSITSRRPKNELRATLLEFLKTIEVTEKR